MICCGFQWARDGPVLSLRRIVVPELAARNARSSPSVALSSGVPRPLPAAGAASGRVAAQCVVGELGLVALAHEEAECALAVARAVGRDGKAADEQLDGGLELVVAVVARERGN